jgi:hemolysin III
MRFMSHRAAVRNQSFGEEIANALSHGLGCLLAVAALPLLVHHAASHGGTADIVAASLFAGTMILLYFVSTLYHALPRGRAKQWLARLDHASIYLFIAGSYMPFLFGVLGGAWGWSLFGVVWLAAAIGVTGGWWRAACRTPPARSCSCSTPSFATRTSSGICS